MARQYSQTELQALGDASAALAGRGVKQELGDSNSKSLIAALDGYQPETVTVEVVLAEINKLVPKLEYVSPLAKKFNELLVTFTVNESLLLAEYLKRFGLIGLDGSNDGFKNALLILDWLRRNGFALTHSNFDFAVKGFATSTDPNNQLKWVETTQRQLSPAAQEEQAAKTSRQAGELFNDESNGNRQFVNGRRNHAFDESVPKPVSSKDNVMTANNETFKAACEVLIRQGLNHSQRDHRQETFEKAFASTQSYRLAYRAVQEVARVQQMRNY